MNYTILLYYKYTHIENPQQFAENHKNLCKDLGLKGRIIIAEEGINGTVEGLTENTDKYIEIVSADPRFSDMSFKKSVGTGNAFPKLSVKARSEIVSAHLGEEDVNPAVMTGKYLDPTELDKWYEEEKDFVIVDMRNDYEFGVGHFENSIMLGMENFRDLPKFLPQLEEFKDKTLVTCCTGGVRCEKASGYLVSKGFKDVYQVEGGMATYMEKHPGRHFKGKLYVFDDRVVMDAPQAGLQEVIGRCNRCDELSESYINCSNRACNIHFICCEDCRDLNNKNIGFCSESCEEVFAEKEKAGF